MEKEEHIGFELRLIHNLVCESMKESRERDGVCLTQLQNMIIRFLIEHRDVEVYQRDLEAAFHSSRATISNTLQVMERNGLITRVQVERDARLKCLQLTEKSMELSRRAKENVEKMEQLLRKGMDEEEVSVFREMLRKVRRNLEEEQTGHNRQQDLP